MTTLTKSKSDLFRLFERFDSADPIKLTRVLTNVGAWPKGRGTPNPDHIAALTIAAMLPVPLKDLGEAYKTVSNLPLVDIKAFTSDAYGRLVSVDLEETRADAVVFLARKNAPTPVLGVRYILGEIAAGRAASPGQGPALTVGTRRPDFVLWCGIKGHLVCLLYRPKDASDGALGFQSIGSIDPVSVKEIAEASQPFIEHSPFRTWDTRHMPPPAFQAEQVQPSVVH